MEHSKYLHHFGSVHVRNGHDKKVFASGQMGGKEGANSLHRRQEILCTHVRSNAVSHPPLGTAKVVKWDRF